jgi:hypothetical protein
MTTNHAQQALKRAIEEERNTPEYKAAVAAAAEARIAKEIVAEVAKLKPKDEFALAALAPKSDFAGM